MRGHVRARETLLSLLEKSDRASVRDMANATFRNSHITIAALAADTEILQDMEFTDCVLVGPAVLLMLDDVHIADSSLEGPDLDALFWEIQPGRSRVVGAIAIRNCSFVGCTFQRIGFAGPASMRALFPKGPASA